MIKCLDEEAETFNHFIAYIYKHVGSVVLSESMRTGRNLPDRPFHNYEGFKIPRTAFLNYIDFVDRRITRL